jgi:hypothetical protein
MRIVKPDAVLIERNEYHNQRLGFYRYGDTIDVNLDDFGDWYKAMWYRKEGGLVHYTSVPALIREWLDSTIFMSTDLEGKQ